MEGDSKDLPAGVEAIRARIASSLVAVNGLRIAEFEQGEVDPRTVLVPRTIEHIDEAMQILADCGAWFEAADAASANDGAASPGANEGQAPVRLCLEVERRLDALSVGRDVADLAFVARLGLGARREKLIGLAAVDDPWRIIAESSSGLREVLKSLSAVSTALGRVYSIGVDDGAYLSELARSLRVRHAYICLLRNTEVLGGAHDGAGAIRALRLAATNLTKLMSKDVYADFRIHDRIQMRDFHQRILEWLRTNQPSPTDRGVRAGERLLQDWIGFTELLAAVNNRSELREHDTKILEAVLPRLEKLGEEEQVPADVVTQLAAVFGRDDDLDAVAGGEQRGPGGPLLAAVRRTLERLGGGGKGQADWMERRGAPNGDGDFL